MCSAEQIVEFYRRATEAAKFSKDTTNPGKKSEFKEIERKWLVMAQNCKCNSEEAQKPLMRRPHRPRRRR